jgi:Na+/melibiose symporter-like transporter
VNSEPNNPKGRRLIWIVVAAFTVQIVVWAAWITFASKHRVAEVPLVQTR